MVSALLLLVMSSLSAHSHGMDVTFSSTNASINTAFLYVYQAERNGGNVSSLVQQLNTAILLSQKAQAENSTNAAQAIVDLENATQIAQRVSQQSVSASAASSNSRLVQWLGSIATVVTVVTGSTITYTQWDRIYRRLWILVYGKYVVKPSDE